MHPAQRQTANAAQALRRAPHADRAQPRKGRRQGGLGALPRRLGVLLAGSAALLMLAACADPPADPAPPAGLDEARFILLGEVHDNPRHHTLRAQWLKALLADRRPTWVVFEQLDATRDAPLQRAVTETPGDSLAVATAGGLDAKAWRWPLHRPLFEAALAGHAHLAGGNLPRDAVRAVVREGVGAAPAALRPLLDDRAWTADQQRAAQIDIDQGHCGALSSSQLGPMATGQRLRDASMAHAMLAARPGSRVVLIAGNGHVRRDRGVPHYLRAAGVPAQAIHSVGFLEIGDVAAPGAFDDVVMTRPEPRPDPCEGFRAAPGAQPKPQ
jgi:uncharacterized iron-regulated protein